MLALYLLWQIYYVHRAPQQASSINIIPFEVVSIDISQPRQIIRNPASFWSSSYEIHHKTKKILEEQWIFQIT